MTELQVKKSVYESKKEEVYKEVCDKYTILMLQEGAKPTKCMEAVATSMGMTAIGVRGILIRKGLYQKRRKYETKN